MMIGWVTNFLLKKFLTLLLGGEGTSFWCQIIKYVDIYKIFISPAPSRTYVILRLLSFRINQKRI